MNVKDMTKEDFDKVLRIWMSALIIRTQNLIQ